jgi:hypothetical protein
VDVTLTWATPPWVVDLQTLEIGALRAEDLRIDRNSTIGWWTFAVASDGAWPASGPASAERTLPAGRNTSWFDLEHGTWTKIGGGRCGGATLGSGVSFVGACPGSGR